MLKEIPVVVLNGGLTIESPSVVFDGVPPAGVVLLGGIASDVEENESLELVDVTNI